MFAASFLLTKALTRHENTGTIIFWQSLTVTVLSFPLALPVWQTVPAEVWVGFAVCGVLGTLGHYMLTHSFSLADISATQSVKFLDLIWSAALGWLLFSDAPSSNTLIGGFLIVGATVWVTHRESRRG